MRKLIVLLLPLLVLGCISAGERGANVSSNETMNLTGDNETQPPPAWLRYNATVVSFEYPANMQTSAEPGVFTGLHALELQPGQTAEMMVVMYLDTARVYGLNSDEEFRAEPTRAASDFLEADIEKDPAAILQYAYEKGNMTTFTIARDGYVAEIPFTARFASEGRSYSGRALDIYFPERSLHLKVRVAALDRDKAVQMRDRFLLNLRLD